MGHKLTQRQPFSTFLDKLGVDGHTVRDYHPLQESMSGAFTYRVKLELNEVVLKVTPASSGRTAMERAQRELAFYRNLADAVPLRVPRVWHSYSDQDGVALLLEALHPSAPPDGWQESAFLVVLRQLAYFHATFWNDTAQLAQYTWLRRQADLATEVQQAHSHWQRLHEQPRFTRVLTVRETARIHRLVDCMEAANTVTQALPLTLCHGDCTTMNVLHDSAGELIWADWQEVRLARGPEDVAFLLERASVAGARVSYDTVLKAYHERLEAEINETISLESVRRVVQAAELRSRVLYWPAYLGQAAESQLAAMLERLYVLAKRLEIAS